MVEALRRGTGAHLVVATGALSRGARHRSARTSDGDLISTMFDIRASTFYFALKDGRSRIENSNCGIGHSRAIGLVVSQATGFYLPVRLPFAGGSNQRAGWQPWNSACC